MNSSRFSPSGTTHTSFVMQDLLEVLLLRIFSCRRDTPELSWFSRTVEDTLYRHCDYMIKEQESWRCHSTRDNYSHIQPMKPFSLFELQQPKLYFHFLIDGLNKMNNHENHKDLLTVQKQTTYFSLRCSSTDGWFLFAFVKEKKNSLTRRRNDKSVSSW